MLAFLRLRFEIRLKRDLYFDMIRNRQLKLLLTISFLFTFFLSIVVAGMAAFMINQATTPVIIALGGTDVASSEPLNFPELMLQSLFWISITSVWVIVAFRWQRTFRRSAKQ